MITVSAPFQLCFSDIRIRFIPPAPVQISSEIAAFLCDDGRPADTEYNIRLMQTPLRLPSTPLLVSDGMAIYRTQEGWLRIFSPQSGNQGCKVACLLRPDGKNTLYIDNSVWKQLTQPLNCFHMIGLEDPLLRRSAFLLHSSVVMYQGKAVLFSGPSGAGKSTQASLWREHLGAQVLNGDRCIVMRKDDGFYGGGSPLAGTSGIYRPEQAPIAGIFLVSHGNRNHIQPLGRNAFAPLFSQTLVNSWDTVFMEKIIELYQELIASVPIYKFECLPDETAVQLVSHTLSF